MLVKYSCGCIGFLPSTSDGESLLVNICDKSRGDYDDYDLGYRDMGGKPSTSLTEEEERKIFQEISKLLHLGYRMRELAHTISSVVKK